MNDYRNSAKWLIVLTIAFAVISTLLFLSKTGKLETAQEIDSNIFADYGTFVGSIATAVFGIITIYLLIQNINDQQDQFNKQQIESRFFELLRIHKENSKTLRGTSFRSLFDEIDLCLMKVNQFNDYLRNLNEKEYNEIEIINIAYLCFFNGVSENVDTRFQTYLNKYNKGLGETTTLAELKNILLKNDHIYKVFYKEHGEPLKGHDNELGHYYRHLFHTIKYIDNQLTLTHEAKYEYISLLRAQLSNEEQILFFFNSLSDLGKKWERDAQNENDKLITKYDFIRNIPHRIVISSIDVKVFYPNVNYENF